MSATFDAQRTALNGLNLIEASAGTGKTWTIAALYARLVLEQQRLPEQILVLTYTKAATAELRSRIRARLVELADAFAREGGSDPFCQALYAATEPEARHAALLRLRAAVSGFDAAAVFTIHSFCQRALAEHALLAGLELEREFVADEAELLLAAADAAWKAELASAGPAWLAWLLARGESPEAWLALLKPYLGQRGLRLALPEAPELAAREARFASRAAELRTRWASEGAAAEAWLSARQAAGDFNGKTHRPDWIAGSLALWRGWLAEDGLPEIKADPKAPGQAEARVRRLYARELSAAQKAGPDVPAVFALFEDFVGAALALNEAYALRLALTHARLLGELAERLDARKAQLGVMSFHDLLVELDAALAGPAGEALAQALRQRYRAALIDEFQDTDPLQFRIFTRLFGTDGAPEPDLAAAGDELAAPPGQAVFLVGDPKQAIYAFRGAELHAYLAARASVPPERRYSLGTNRRSTPELVGALGQLFGASPTPFLIDGLSYPPVDALPDKPRLYLHDEVQAALQWDWLHAEPADEVAGLGKGAARSQAVRQTARRIAALLAPGAARLDAQPLCGGDIAVLGSSHAELQAMQDALAELGVASVRISQQSVFDSEEARDLLQVLTALVTPNERSVRAAMATVSLGLDAASLYRILHDEVAWEATVADFRRWQQRLQQRGAMAALSAWLIESGAAERIAGWRDGERRLTNLLQLFELIELARRERPGLGPLLAWYRQALADSSGEDEGRLMRLESDASRVRLVTIHASKGLEYPLVFCPFLWDGSLARQGESLALCHEDGANVLDFGSPDFEARRARMLAERLAEKLRLLYVALTRPRCACFIAWGEVKDMRSAALAWLLAGGSEQQRSAAEWQRELAGLIAAAAPLGMAWAAPLDEAAAALAPPAPAPQLQLGQIKRRLSWQWRMSSFSGLTAGLHAEAPDHDGQAQAPLLPDEAPPGRFEALPAGARAGICLHGLFEEWEFTRHDRPALEALAERTLRLHGFEPEWRSLAADLVDTTLATPLGPTGACLNTVGPRQRLVELEFTYRLQPFAWAELAALLADPAHGLPPACATAAASLSAEVGAGYLKGFIDLACQLDGRHYVIDWKSNRLSGYGTAAVEAAIVAEHYYLQALVYCVALHRYLRWRQPGYDYARDFGGAIYLFLRGLPGGGQWQYRPPLALLQGLEQLLCGDRP